MTNQDTLFSVDGHGIIVTGAASGIGKAIACGLSVRGARVTALDLNEAGLKQLAGLPGNEHMRTVTGDAANERVVSDLVAGHLEAFGRLDSIFANAGIAGPMLPTDQLSLQDFQRVLRINVESGFLLSRAAIPVFRAAGRGRIILTSSVWGVRGEANAPITSYATSKGAVTNLTRQLAVELAAERINVNAILPAAIETAIADGFYDNPEAVSALLRHVPAGRVVGPEAVCGAAVFLASEASAWVTGQLLAVDGGYLAT